MSAVSGQITTGAATVGRGVSSTSEIALLVAYAPPQTRATRSAHLNINVATAGRGVVANSQAVTLVAYRTGGVPNLKSRAWTFTLDGHPFYVLFLGNEGTFVYDQSTGSWSKWITTGLPTWNMEKGVTWKGDIIAVDNENPILWRIDPTSFIDDDFKPQIRKVTGGLSMRGRNFVANYAFRIAASMGLVAVPVTAPPTDPTVRLRFSDDQGNTFIDAGTKIITPGAFQQALQWLSLGTMQPPVRVFEVTDTGAIARIDGADAEVGED